MKHEGMAGANLLWLADALAVDGPALARMDIRRMWRSVSRPSG